MLFLLSLVIRAVARLLAGRRTDDGSKDLEILVLSSGSCAGRPAARGSGRSTG